MWLKNIRFTGVVRDILERALGLSGNVKIIKKTFKTSPGYAKPPAINLLAINITKSSDLKFIWGRILRIRKRCLRSKNDNSSFRSKTT
jgi:hypothetical protein